MNNSNKKKSQVIRILIADDHSLVREGVAALINRQPDLEVVAEAANGREAVELYRVHKPDIAMLDLRMPEVDGVEATTTIRQDAPDARVICLTTFDGDEDIFRSLRAGVNAYLLKDAGREELINCIRAVHRGETWMPRAIAAKLAMRVSRPGLTRREKEVINLLALGKSNKEIGNELRVSEGTVKVHLNHIFEKLGVSGRTGAITEAMKRGIVRLPAK